ncbi:MAG: hypothetical protein RLZZ232_3839 [Planctomycetota bacterium]|jgi:hypothetical protein
MVRVLAATAQCHSRELSHPVSASTFHRRGVVAEESSESTAMGLFDSFEQFQRFRDAWSSIRIERPVEVGLFTFGDTELPYYLITSSAKNRTVGIRRGSVTISRARIITADSLHPELRNFFEENDDAGFFENLLTRSAAFSNLRMVNDSGPDSIVTDTVEEAVERLNRQLDAEDEERVAILSAPVEYSGFAIFRYATERVLASAPGNIQELRERGFLP